MIERVLLFAENRYARLILVGLMVLSLQTTVFNDMRPFGVCLQVMVLLAASAGLARGSDVGAIAGFIIDCCMTWFSQHQWVCVPLCLQSLVTSQVLASHWCTNLRGGRGCCSALLQAQ